MAITLVTEITKDRPGTWKQEARNYKRYFQAFSDDISDTAYDVLSHADIPVLGKEHPKDDLVEVTQLDANIEEENARLVWSVVAIYEKSNIGLRKPWEEDPLVNFSYKNYGTIITKAYDYTNEAEVRPAPSLTIENSAHYQYNPPVMKEDSNTLIRITFKLPYKDFDMESAKLFKDTINKDKVKIGGIKLPIHTGRIIKISPLLKKYTDTNLEAIAQNGTAVIYYWEVVYEVELNPIGWALAADDYSYKDVDGKYYKNDSNNSSDQYKLDGAGSFKADQTAAAESKKWNVYWQEDWKPLNFPEEVQLPDPETEA